MKIDHVTLSNSITPLFKPRGLTPLQAVRRFAEINHITTKSGYAGRLDPLAEGVLVGLFGEANKQQSSLIKLDKRYQFDLIMGIATDSFDLLGIPEVDDELSFEQMKSLSEVVKDLQGTIEQSYPPFSAVRVEGRPLYHWARQQKLSKIIVPSMSRTIHSLTVGGFSEISSGELLSRIRHDVDLIKGNFRQSEILNRWQLLLEHNDQSWLTISFELHCSSGTYVRSLVDTIGKSLGTSATTLAITRTAVGNYTLKDCLNI